MSACQFFVESSDRDQEWRRYLSNYVKRQRSNYSFCFSWANEPWARTWDGQNTNILMAQEYGSEKEWEEHFNYLNQFFKDERYIKVNNKPMLLYL